MGQGFVAGGEIEQFLVDRTLAQPVKVAVQIIKQVIDVSVGAFHGGQTAGVFAGQ